MPAHERLTTSEITKSLRVASAQGSYPLPPSEQPGYMFAGRAVVVDSALLDEAADLIDGLLAVARALPPPPAKEGE